MPLTAGQQLDLELAAIRETATAQATAIAALEARVAALEAAPPVGTEPPPVPPVNPPPALKRIVTIANPSGDGIRKTNNDPIADTHVGGFNQNAVSEGIAGRHEWSNVRSVKALRRDSKAAFEGQGFYLDGGFHVLSGCATSGNGWRKEQAGREYRNQYAHGVYCNVGTELDTVDYVGCENGYAGIQARGPSRHARPVFIGNGCGFAGIYGPHTIANGVFLDPQLYGGKKADDARYWEGAFGIYGWGQITLRDCLFIMQELPLAPYAPPGVAEPNKLPIYLGGMIKLDRRHPQYPDTPGGVLDAQGCVYSWKGPIFTGDQPHDGHGFTAKSLVKRIDYQPTINAMLANEISVQECNRRIRDEAWGSVA